jgi:deoxyribonuclease IV
MKIGAHESIQGGFSRAVERAVADGCASMQIFTKSPQIWREPTVTGEDVAAFRKARDAVGFGPVVVHASYLINTCAASPATRAKGSSALAAEARRCDLLGAEYLVFHPGSPGDQGDETGIRLTAESVRAALGESDSVSILVENTAGQGKGIGWRFEHLAAILELAGGGDRLGVCVDTCHASAAGYALSNGDEAAALFDEIDRLLGRGRVRALHLNDAKSARGSRVDRHALIGKGELGLPPFRWLVNAPRFADVPGIVETPIAKGETYAAEVAALGALVDKRR